MYFLSLQVHANQEKSWKGQWEQRPLGHRILFDQNHHQESQIELIWYSVGYLALPQVALNIIYKEW